MNTDGTNTPWHRRLQSFHRAVMLLREPVDRGIDDLSPLEKEGTAQRFEIAVELAWKTLKDYLEHQGVVLEPVTPRTVVKQAFAAGILPDGQVWIDMLTHRNLLSHTYDEEVLDEVVSALEQRYLAALVQLLSWLERES